MKYVGPLSVIDAVLADHAEAVVREAVSNAVRHAGATTLSGTVGVGDDLGIIVRVDGTGIGAGVTGSGSSNPARRADEVGGSFAVRGVAEGGTELAWTALLPRPPCETYSLRGHAASFSLPGGCSARRIATPLR